MVGCQFFEHLAPGVFFGNVANVQVRRLVKHLWSLGLSMNLWMKIIDRNYWQTKCFELAR